MLHDKLTEIVHHGKEMTEAAVETFESGMHCLGELKRSKEST
jgi:hypothetical protein